MVVGPQVIVLLTRMERFALSGDPSAVHDDHVPGGSPPCQPGAVSVPMVMGPWAVTGA